MDKQKAFLSYKYTGKTLDELHLLIDPVMDILRTNHNLDVYCNLYEEQFYRDNNYSVGDIMRNVLDKLKECGYHITLADDRIGEGMCVEFGYAYNLGLKQILIIRSDIPSDVLRGLATQVVDFDSLDTLHDKIKGIEFSFK